MVVIPLDGIWTPQRSTLSHLLRFLLGRTVMSRTTRLGIHPESDPGVRAQCLSLGIRRGRPLRGREKTLPLVLRVTFIHPSLLVKRIRTAPLGMETTTPHHCLRGCLLDPYPILLDPLLAIIHIPLVRTSTGDRGTTTKDQGVVTRQDHRLKDTTGCHLQEDITKVTIRGEPMRGMIGGSADLPRGVDRGFTTSTRSWKSGIPTLPGTLDYTSTCVFLCSSCTHLHDTPEPCPSPGSSV